jgi:hypothetical protein
MDQLIQGDYLWKTLDRHLKTVARVFVHPSRQLLRSIALLVLTHEDLRLSANQFF